MLHLAPGLEGLVVAKVEAVQGHPDADRLSVCQVDAGGGVLQVVCGAPNVQAGGLYPFAPAGSVLPGGTAIEAVSIRGVESNGMLCSEAELGMGPDADGIMALERRFHPGEPLAGSPGAGRLADGRGDHRQPWRPPLPRGRCPRAGFAGGRALILPPIPGSQGSPGASGIRASPWRRGRWRYRSEGVTVRIQDPDLCSRYLGAVIRGVKVGPSPPWLASRIRAAGSRPINNVVDATNYVLLELGQPLHAFDLAKLARLRHRGPAGEGRGTHPDAGWRGPAAGRGDAGHLRRFGSGGHRRCHGRR